MDILTVLNVHILLELLDGGRELLPRSSWCSESEVSELRAL